MQNNSLINLAAASSEEANIAVNRELMERIVLDAFGDKPMSARDIARALGGRFEITSIRPRLTELTHKGQLAQYDRAFEKESKKKVTRWIKTIH